MTSLHEHYQIIRRPLLTEKSTARQGYCNQYAFLVHPNANKVQIRKAIEALFNVKVVQVNTMVRHGKHKRLGWRAGKSRDWKRALVKLAAGNVIELAS